MSSDVRLQAEFQAAQEEKAQLQRRLQASRARTEPRVQNNDDGVVLRQLEVLRAEEPLQHS